ncbi:MAG TPA: M3 family metallopeptidase, partial [Longimicrobiales bacterium]|nr:M3 family metallopeptidase [Longimicrobiales bacterium]
MTDRSNPVLADRHRIPFDRIRPEHVGPGVRRALEEAQADIDAIGADAEPPTWDNTLARLEDATQRLARRVVPASHLMSVAETRPLREAYNDVLPEISAFWSRLPLNEALWKRIRGFADTDEAAALEGLRRRHLDKTLQDFRRAGAELPPGRKKRLEALRVELAQLQQRFSENVLDATAAYELLVEDEARLAGVPEAARRRARVKAEEKGEKGWLLTLDYPSVEPILKYCDDRALREEIHLAFTTRCREGAHDNRGLIARILRLRQEQADILGYASFPDYVLEDRMAKLGARAIAFERDLRERTRPYWERDSAELRRHAATLGIPGLEPWDVGYVTEKLRRERYDIDDEALRPYFPLNRVLEGLFEIVRRVFGFRVE